METKKISVNRKRFDFLPLAAALWFLLAANIDPGLLYPVSIIIITGSVIFGFLSLSAWIYSKFKHPEIIINKYNLVDKSSLASVGEISFNDIHHIEHLKTNSKINPQNLVLVFLKNPGEYINNRNLLKRWLLNTHIKSYGTPAVIDLSVFHCPEVVRDQLMKLLIK